ncbi:MAG: Gfo/Idh/MocA family oxidoreductase [Actinobacteria bacterium]|nr:MAG: Gfo/Idh/MocA family oxidoreductase [Actinomycetota bacterium]
MSVKWGLLSTALINEAILAGAAESSEVDVIGVASRDEARAQDFAREHGIERAYGSYEGLLADADVEAVYISLPNGLHDEWVLRALEAGKHVLVEKPFSRHPDEVEQAFDVAEAGSLVLSEGFMWRHHPQTVRLIELVDSGTIGPLRLVRAAFGFPLAKERGPADTRFDPALDGGALMDVGSYCVNALRLLGGEPERARGEQVVGPSGVDVVFTGALAFAGELVGHFDCGFVVPRRAGLELVGEEGIIFVGNPFTIAEPGIELRRADGELEQIAIEPVNHYRLELENVSAAIRGEGQLLLGREDAVGQARTIETLYRSAAAAG